MPTARDERGARRNLTSKRTPDRDIARARAILSLDGPPSSPFDTFRALADLPTTGPEHSRELEACFRDGGDASTD